MSERKAVWSKLALKDTGATLDYWDEHNKSPNYSNKLTDMIAETVALIVAHPSSGIKTTKEFVRFKRVDEQYLLIYRIESKQIRVLRFIDKRRDVKKLKMYFK